MIRTVYERRLLSALFGALALLLLLAMPAAAQPTALPSAQTAEAGESHIVIDEVTFTIGNDKEFEFYLNTSSGSPVDYFSLAGSTGERNIGPLPPGTYTVSQLVNPYWDLTSLDCSSANVVKSLETRSASIPLAAGETVTCTFTNTAWAGIQIIEDSGAGDPQDFAYSFTTDTGTSIPGFSLDDDSDSTLHDYEWSNRLKPGSYTITQGAVAGWALTNLDCGFSTSYQKSLESRTATVALNAGEFVTCAFFNSRATSVASDLTATATANPSFTRTYSWSIAKGVDREWVETRPGSSASFNYTVTAAQMGVVAGGWQVVGAFTVINPNDVEASGVNVTGAVNNGGTCAVTGETSFTILGKQSKVVPFSCSYVSAPNPAAGTITATVTWSDFGSPGTTASHQAVFGFDTVAVGNPTEVNKSVTLSDTFEGATTTLGTLVGTLAPPYATQTFSYQHTLTAPDSGCRQFTNTATVVETAQSSVKTVTVCGTMKPGGLSTGFWQNKNGQQIIAEHSGGMGGTSLSDFLTSYAPFNDLTATTGSGLAEYVTSVIKGANSSGGSMNAMLKAQMLATALDVYFSDATLGGDWISASSPLGGTSVDLTKRGLAGQDVTAAFGGATSMTASQMLAYASSQSDEGGSLWYGNDKPTQELAKNGFEALNSQKLPGS